MCYAGRQTTSHTARALTYPTKVLTTTTLLLTYFNLYCFYIQLWSLLFMYCCNHGAYRTLKVVFRDSPGPFYGCFCGTFEDHLCPFSMSFQDCLVFNQVDIAGSNLTAGHLQATFSKCAQVNSASYPLREGKPVVAYRLRGEGLV